VSNYLAWAIIPLVLMIVAAPIFYVLPTSRDKYLTALRLRAKYSGCLVKMASLDKLDVIESELVRSSGRVVQPKYQLMSYTRLIQSKVDFHHSFLFRRISDRTPQSISRLSKDWGVVIETTQINRTAEPDSRVSFLDKYAKELIRIFQALPLDVQGLSIDSKRLVIFWNESQGAIGKRKRLSNEKIEQKAKENLEPINVCFCELENLIDRLS
jgi:Mg2+ and Co2+ transporter CorA